MKSIAIIPARGGSKRIPRKNIKEFLSKPIIAYSIEAALKSGAFDEVMVSTDDKEIAEISRKYGASVPFFRSEELSTDMAMTVPVLIDVLENYKKKGLDYEQLCCIYPCAPFITAARLKEGMDLLASPKVDGAFPVTTIYPPQKCFVVRNGKIAMLHPEYYNVRSQDLEPHYQDAGQFYCIKTNSLIEEKIMFCRHTLPIFLTKDEVQDIDTEEDWKEAEKKYRTLKGI